MKKIVISVMLLVVLFVFSGCGSNNANKANENNTSQNTNTSNTTKKEESKVDYKSAAEKQMSKPNEGDTIAILKIKNFGDIKVKFFPEIAPKAVENFITHAKDGYYNGVIFHRVIDEFMIQGGDPEGTGRGGESIWGKGFGTELDYSLVPYRGSLCMAMSSLPDSIGSQFFITQANPSEYMETYLKQYGYPSELLEMYKQYGGYMSLYMQYTVFGQVFEGMDVVDAIAKVKTQTTADGQENKPVEDVVIENIEVTTYSEK